MTGRRGASRPLKAAGVTAWRLSGVPADRVAATPVSSSGIGGAA